MPPGVNGHHTGTVPKIKTHNDPARDYSQARRREHSLNTVPNNLVTLEWQPAPDMRHSRTRKTSNTLSASIDYYDFVPENSVPHDNSRFVPQNDLQGDEQQMSWGAINRYTQEMNGHSEGSASTSGSMKRSGTARNVLPDRENKSSNINKMPDRNQVVSHLNQIHDYIKQTSSLMDALKNSGDPRLLDQYQRLSKMIADLQQSERRLKGFLPEYSNNSQPELNQKVEDSKSENCTVEGISEASSSLPDRLGDSVNANSLPALPSGVLAMGDGAYVSRSYSEDPRGGVLKSSDSARRNELKMKVEESQRRVQNELKTLRLQALQDHQAALLTLQQKAQDQLKEAKVAQGILMARAVGAQRASSPTPPLVVIATDENSSGCINENSNSQTGLSVPRQTVNSSQTLQGNMQHLASRLETLQELYENRNQLVQMLGERDEELVSEHMVLQDKLQELQYKKQHMDHLVAEFQALNSLPGVNTGSQTDAASSKNESENGDGDLGDEVGDYQVVRDKIAELNMMKAQLAQLKGFMSEVQNRGENIVGITQNGIDDGSAAKEGGEEVEHEDQAVNLRRQKKDKSKGGLARTNSNTSATGSNKPDNIVQASSEVERARDIQQKTIQLQEAKARLQHLQDLLAAVSDFHNHGQPVPDQYLELLSQEAIKEEGSGDASKGDRQPSRSQRQSVQREKTPVRQQVQDSSNEPENAEVNLEVVQAMTHELRQQTQTLQEERERLVTARRELGKLQREIPFREKKTNTQVDSQTHQQMLLQAELQAKRHELEELMRKDQGQTSAINQDICSEASADKSETPGYSFLAEGTTNATWGGSTQGTLDDLAEQDNDIHEQSVGYSSDDGQDDEEEENRRFPAGSSQQLRLSQLNNNSINNNKDSMSQSHASSRDMLSMSLDLAHMSAAGNINTNHSNTTSTAGSVSQAPPRPASSNRSQRQSAASHNIWRKSSGDSGITAPRAVWTPSSQQARQENLCTAEELVTSNNLDTNNSSSSATLHNASITNTNSNINWWQQQALQLQQQLELTNNLYQSLLLDQGHQRQQQQQPQPQHQHGNNLLPAVGTGSNVLPYWNFPPPPYLAPQPPAAGGIGHLLPTSDAYYQHLLAASQLQQQQMLLTTVNQCCHLLWLQQREIMALRAAVHSLQEKTPCGNSSRRGENYSPPILIGQPEEAILITSNQNSAQPTPHQSQSNLTRLQQTTTNPSMTTFTPHQNLKLSYSGGLFQSPEDLTGSSGVTSAHSLPNLSQVTTSASSVFSPHHTDSFPSNPPLNNVAPSFNAAAPQTSAQSFPTGTLTLTFPMNNSVNFNNRSQQQPLSSLIQCSAPQPGSGAPWLQQGGPGGNPGLLQNHTTPSPVPALNNQVPPGNRANNYWDNFRSYSRQNLLSTSTKSNEGISHSPSPLVDRSHNTLRSSVSQSSSFVTSGMQPTTSVLSHSIGTVYSTPEHNGQICNMARKEKLNTEQYQSTQDNLTLPGPPHNNMSDTTTLHYQLIGTPSSSCSPRSRNRHNSSEFQLQPNISRSRVMGISQTQSLTNDIPQDIQYQTAISEMQSLEGASQHVLSGHHSYSPVPEFQLQPSIAMEARNITLAGQDIHEQHFALDSVSSYQNNQSVRGDEDSEHLHSLKSQGTKVIGINKKKNPKISKTGMSHSHQNCRAGHESAVSTTDHKRQTSNALFEALSESVYSEVAALISANQNRPHFLIQLFRDLQMISSDPLRQRTLQSIQEVVSRHLGSETNDGRESTESHQLQTENSQLIQNDSDINRNAGGSAISSDDETVKNEASHHMAESLRSSLVEQSGDARCMSAKCGTSSGQQSIAESEEGAVALLPSSHSSSPSLPRNAVWSIKDEMSLPNELTGRISKLDWEVQTVLVDLLPFLKSHLEDTCSTTLLEKVRRLTLQLVPAQNIANSTQHSPQHTRLGCCYQGQLDALLEDALLKFQGCRLGDISEELLTVVAEVLLSELTFLRLVDTVSRGDNPNEDNEECCKNPPVREYDLEEHSKSSATSSHQPSESSQHFMSSERGNHSYHDPQEVTLGAEGYNGDLAEADQSHHEETVNLLSDMETESAGAICIGEKDLMEIQNRQTESSASCSVENAIDATENELIQADVLASERSGDFNNVEVNIEEEWEVEQDREQGLDRVPTRLSTEQQRPCSGRSSPERDVPDLASHPLNQPDAPP